MWIVKNQCKTGRFLDDFLAEWADQTEGFSHRLTRGAPVQVESSDKENKVLIELPGVAKKDIGIEFKNGYLIVEANKEKSDNDQCENITYSELAKGNVKRSVYVGDVDFDQAKAELKDGILFVTLPKVEEKKSTLVIQ